MEPDTSNLPDVVRRLVEIVGLATTLLLVDQHGGQSFRLYATGEAMKRLAGTIGEDDAALMLEAFGSDEFEIPLCAAVLRAARNARIHADFDRMTTQEGLSARETVHHLANLYRPMRERSVWRILKQSGDPGPRKRPKPGHPNQMSLL